VARAGAHVATVLLGRWPHHPHGLSLSLSLPLSLFYSLARVREERRACSSARGAPGVPRLPTGRRAVDYEGGGGGGELDAAPPKQPTSLVYVLHISFRVPSAAGAAAQLSTPSPTTRAVPATAAAAAELHLECSDPESSDGDHGGCGGGASHPSTLSFPSSSSLDSLISLPH